MQTVSVVIPCYNASRYIVAAIQSVASQTYAPFEILVVDDGSDDDSMARIETSGTDVVLLRTRRAGPAGARLEAIRHAKGDWIAYLDADDVWYPTHLKAALDALAGTTDVAYMGHLACAYNDATTSFLPSTGPLLDSKTSGMPHQRFLELFARRWYFSPNSVVQLRERVLEVGGPDPRIVGGEDVELFLRVIHERTWTYNPEAHWCYRLGTPGSVSGNRLSCEEGMLSALLKSEPLYRGRTMSLAICRNARRVMAMAFMSGNSDDQQRALRVALPNVPLGFRAFYRAMQMWPFPFRRAIAMKRRLQWFIWRMRTRVAAARGRHF